MGQCVMRIFNTLFSPEEVRQGLNYTLCHALECTINRTLLATRVHILCMRTSIVDG